MFQRRISFVILSAGLACIAAVAPLSAKNGKVPDSPLKITYKSLDWKVPRGEPYRNVLANGCIVYVAEDQTLPLVFVSGYVRIGRLKDPAGKEGLCDLLAALMRTGGTQLYQSDSLDATIDMYAIKAKISAGETQLQFGFSCLAEYTDVCLGIVSQMLFFPAFEEKKVKKYKELFIEDIYHRFDNPRPVLHAAYEKAMYGGGLNSRLTVVRSIEGISRSDLLALHRSVFKPGNMICAVSGKFQKDTMLKRLFAMFPKTAVAGANADTAFPAVALRSPQKLLFIKKTATQSYVRLGLPFIKRPNPDYYAASVLNMVLGGESFTSRLGTKIRSDEGLTYSIYSNAESNYVFPGTFYIEFHTKSESTCRAISLSLAEVNQLKKTGITQEELDHAKSILIDGFPSMFRSPRDIVENYAMNEYLGRPADHFAVYPEKIRSLTGSDIQKAANAYLDPSAFTYVVVGDSSAVYKNDTAADFSLKKMAPARFSVPDSVPYLP